MPATKSSPRVHTMTPRKADDGAYVVPLIHTHVPAPAVEIGFWGALAAAAVFGVVDLPLALVVGAGVALARHQRR